MMRTDYLLTAIIGGVAVSGPSETMANTFGLEYVTEWQTDFRGGYDWLNLLKGSSNISLCRGITFETSAMSVAKVGNDPLLQDLLTYSNIEAGNIVLTFGKLGFGFNIRGAEFFAGINNVNEDYFTSEMTSLFTNSSCGISPTISCNYDIANYPLAAWCLHYRQSLGDFSIQTSIYPGKGHSRIFGHDNLFSLNLKRDGIFSISTLDFKRNGIYCVLGAALYHGVCICDEQGWAEETPPAPASPSKSLSVTPWVLCEFELPCNFGVLAHASWSSVRNGCKIYAGIGALYQGKGFQPGIELNYASFGYTSERTAELTCRVQLPKISAYLQPALHLVSSNRNRLACIGLLRFGIEI